jgi:SatD family (SatD)
MAKKKHYLLLGDVINSRHIKNRQAFKIKLTRALQYVSTTIPQAFAKPLQSWKGVDEVAAIITNPSFAYNIINEINNIIAPVTMRFVLSEGEADIKAGAQGGITEMDGKIFHDAASKMTELKQEGWLFAATGNNNNTMLAFSNWVNALVIIKQRWTNTQKKIFEKYKAEKNQEAIAKALKITQQSVSKTLTVIEAKKVMALEDNLNQWAYATFTNK